MKMCTLETEALKLLNDVVADDRIFVLGVCDFFDEKVGIFIIEVPSVCRIIYWSPLRSLA